jgi:hypothetical protein
MKKLSDNEARAIGIRHVIYSMFTYFIRHWGLNE